MLRLKATQGNLNCMILENNGLYMMQINFLLNNKAFFLCWQVCNRVGITISGIVKRKKRLSIVLILI